MKSAMKMFASFIKDEESPTMVEYALMILFIAVVCVGAVAVLGTKTLSLFQSALPPFN